MAGGVRSVFLSDECLERFKRKPGKYQMKDNSTLSSYLQVWWEWVAKLMPVWISANVITVAAVIPNAVCMACVLGVGYPVPYWLQLCCALSVFTFQTFDAVDGKQARNLKTSSPLGDFLDHVVDSVCIMVISVTILVTLNARLWMCAFCLFNVALNFVAVHWEAAKTEVMIMDDGSSITEAQVMMSFVFVVAPLFGHGLWSYVVAPRMWGGLTVAEVVLFLMVGAVGIKQSIVCLRRVYQQRGARIFLETAPYAVSLLLYVEWCGAYGARGCVLSMLLLTAFVILESSCVTLNRIGHYVLNWKVMAPIMVPALVVPLFSHGIPSLPLCCIVWSYLYLGFFLFDVVTSVAKTLGVPVFANPAFVYAKKQ